MDATDNKRQMRQLFRKKRDEFASTLPPNYLALAFSTAPSPLRDLFLPGRILAFYLPIGSEADPRALTTCAVEAGCRTALPYVEARSTPMRFLFWNEGDALEEGPFGLQQPSPDREPATPDIILTPLVAFDRRCNRIGQGAGHYDRAISILPDAITIGIAWSVQEADCIPVDPWDQPLDAILTEREWILP